MNFLRKRIKAKVGPYLGDEPDKPSKKHKRGVSFLGVEVNNPFHFHCGPGNDVLDEKSSDPVDENCRIHDQQYGFMEVENPGLDPKFYTSDADRQFIANQLSTKSVFGAMYALPFIVKNAIAPEWPVRSFSKSDTMVKTVWKKKRGRRRSRISKRKKPIKKITKLQVYKAIGNRLEERRITIRNLIGDWRASPDSGHTTNNSYMYHIGTLNDYWHYSAGEAIVHGSQASTNLQDPTASPPYFLNTYMKVFMSNFSNVNLRLTPVKVTLKNNLDNENTLNGYTDESCAYTYLKRVVYLVQQALPLSTGAKFTVGVPSPDSPGGGDTRRPTCIEFPTDCPIPFKLLRKDADIQIGSPFVFPVRQSMTIHLKGKKGFCPSYQMLATSPSDGQAGSVPRSPNGFAKKTTMFFYIVEPQSHFASTSDSQPLVDAFEVYNGSGNWRIAITKTRVTQFTGVPIASQLNVAERQVLNDLRPNADAAGATPRAVLDLDTNLSGIPTFL